MRWRTREEMLVHVDYHLDSVLAIKKRELEERQAYTQVVEDIALDRTFYPCGMCDSQFRSPMALYTHMDYHLDILLAKGGVKKNGNAAAT